MISHFFFYHKGTKAQRVKTWCLCVLVVFVFNFGIAQKIEVPILKGYVNDNAEMISPQEKNNLEQFLSQYEDETSNQIVVLTLATIGEENIEEFSIRVVEKNLIGQKEKNNGVLILVVRDSRAIRIETGYGLEGALTDAISFDIIRNIITPEFQQGNFYAGIANGVVAVTEVVKGEFKGTGNRKRHNGNGGWGKLLWIGIIIVAFLFQGIFGRRRGFVG